MDRYKRPSRPWIFTSSHGLFGDLDRATMRVLPLILLSLASVLAAPSDRELFEKEIVKNLDLDQFEVDKKILAGRVAEEAAEHAEEAKELLSHIPLIPEGDAEAERAEEAVNSAIANETFEGDILLTKEQLAAIVGDVKGAGRSRRQAYTPPGRYPSNIWGTQIIPFSFAPSASEEIKRLFRLATRFWSTHTCVNFGENHPGNDRIEVVSGGGCSSHVGRIGGKQQLSLSNDGCNRFATATHELEHALGVYHEQSRPDRANFVDIVMSNIQKSMQYNFYAQGTHNTSSFDVPYEFGSNMHYTQDSFALDYRQPTILARPYYKQYQNSMRGHQPSFLDILLVNRFYSCDQKCKTKANFCKNGGYLDVRTCSRCVCPEGTGGHDCNGKPDGCLVELTATTSFQKRSITLGQTGREREDFETCNYVINAPQSRRIQLQFDGVWGYSGQGCQTNGIEVKPATDLRPRGIRNCGSVAKPEDIISSTNRLPIIVWSRSGQIRADVQFRYY